MTDERRDAAWDDRSWAEHDTPWTAGCRWLQAWWRHHELGLAPGARRPTDPDRLVASMLPFDAPTDANFLTADIASSVRARLAEGNHSGIIDSDRLMRNLLSSQPTCFNLFGPFVDEPDALLGWVRTIDQAADTVTGARFEWAPPRLDHFGGGSAFDALVTYGTTNGDNRFLGVEVKYAENLEESSITVRDPYREYTEANGLWREGAAGRLDTPRLRQFWLNTLLGQSLVKRGTGFQAGTVVIVAPGADRSAAAATDAVRTELIDPDQWLRWSPYEAVLAAVDDQDAWKRRFRQRYLDFSPVRHLLFAHDPRVVDHLP